MMAMNQTELSETNPAIVTAPVRVLIVDDHALVRDALIHMLQATMTFQPVGHAGDGAAGIALARTLQPDIALVDFGLPEIDGAETAQEISRVSPRTRVIILSEVEK